MTERIIARALAYPFDPHPEPFLFVEGRAAPLAVADAAQFRGRVPILAVGSNASPVRLAEKFGPGARIPVTFAVVEDHMVAHSAKITSYGSMPATLHPWEGAHARVHATWLTDAELAAMDETESLGVEYHRVAMPARLLDAPATGAHPQTYVSIAGALTVGGVPVASLAATHEGAPPPALDQRAAQALAMAHLELEHALESFIVENVSDRDLRLQRTHDLSTRAGLHYDRSRD